MPTYQYRCTGCGRELEVVQKFTDPSLTECPECSGALKKVFNAVGVVFKGSGFYRTDSRTNGSGSGAAAKGADASGGTGEKAGAGATGSGSDGSAGSSSTGSGSNGSSSNGSGTGSGSTGSGATGSGTATATKSKTAATAG